MTVEQDVARLVELQAQQREIEAEYKEVRKRVLDALSPGEHDFPYFTVSIRKSHQPALDITRLKAALGERFNEYLKGPTWQVVARRK